MLFFGCGLKFPTPLRGTNTKTTQYFLSQFFRLSALRRYRKALVMDLVRLNTLRGTNSTPLPFYEYIVEHRLFISAKVK